VKVLAHARLVVDFFGGTTASAHVVEVGRVSEKKPALRSAHLVVMLANMLAGCQVVSGLSRLETERDADSGTVSAAAGRSVAAADTDAGMTAPRTARMPDAAHDDVRETHIRDGGVRSAVPVFDAAVGGAGGEAEEPVAGQGGSAGSATPDVVSAGSSAASAGSGGRGADAGVQIEVDSDETLGNTNLRVSDILGYYSGNWGQMILRKQGNEIIGVYEHRDGTLIGEIDDEGVFAGWWTQTPTRTGLDAGEVEFRWSKTSDGAAVALDGRWRYGSDGEWLENWDVLRVSDRSAPSQLSDRFERTDDFRRRP
jgi:hypothetical protein